eukprot:Awhi_evm1s1451
MSEAELVTNNLCNNKNVATQFKELSSSDKQTTFTTERVALRIDRSTSLPAEESGSRLRKVFREPNSNQSNIRQRTTTDLNRRRLHRIVAKSDTDVTYDTHGTIIDVNPENGDNNDNDSELKHGRKAVVVATLAKIVPGLQKGDNKTDTTKYKMSTKTSMIKSSPGEAIFKTSSHPEVIKKISIVEDHGYLKSCPESSSPTLSRYSTNTKANSNRFDINNTNSNNNSYSDNSENDNSNNIHNSYSNNNDDCKDGEKSNSNNNKKNNNSDEDKYDKNYHRTNCRNDSDNIYSYSRSSNTVDDDELRSSRRPTRKSYGRIDLSSSNKPRSNSSFELTIAQNSKHIADRQASTSNLASLSLSHLKTYDTLGFREKMQVYL